MAGPRGTRAHSSESARTVAGEGDGEAGGSREPDPARVLLEADQEAARDAAVYDVPSLLADDRPLLFTRATAAWRDHQQAESWARTEHALQAVDGAALRLRTGDGKQDGEAALRERAATAHAEEARTEAVLAEAKDRLDAAAALPPSGRSWRTRLSLWARMWVLSVLAPPLEFYVVAGAVSMATRSENPWEKWFLAAIILFGLSVLPKLAGSSLHAVRVGKDPAHHLGAVFLASVVWLGAVYTVARMRADASAADRALGASAGGFQFPGVTPGAEPVETGSAWLFVFYLVVITAFSLAIFLNAWLSPAPEQLAWFRARAELEEARAQRIRAEQDVAALNERLAFLEMERAAIQRAGEQHAAEVVPALAGLRVDEYHLQLARHVGDPAFTDALRLVDRSLEPTAQQPPAAAEGPPARHERQD
ncbi:hypothetical protein [Georgenia daeguensis]|uniref:Uncharacterized protein n=1 Tax=Georgenia daeguensis TaxID=908355 RepID=A0ABP8ESR5_9MICO